MTREEKIKLIAGLADVNVPKQDTTDSPLTSEELHVNTLKELAKLTDVQLDEVIDKIWEAIRRLYYLN